MAILRSKLVRRIIYMVIFELLNITAFLHNRLIQETIEVNVRYVYLPNVCAFSA